jgi:hypothetical protein
LVFLIVRANDLSNIQDRQGQAQDQIQQAFCNFLETALLAPPETAFGRELARRSAVLAAQFYCVP